MKVRHAALYGMPGFIIYARRVNVCYAEKLFCVAEVKQAEKYKQSRGIIVDIEYLHLKLFPTTNFSVTSFIFLQAAEFSS